MENQQLRTEIDSILQKMASIECNLGMDSTKEEIALAKQQKIKLLEQIKSIDKEFYNQIVPI